MFSYVDHRGGSSIRTGTSRRSVSSVSCYNHIFTALPLILTTTTTFILIVSNGVSSRIRYLVAMIIDTIVVAANIHTTGQGIETFHRRGG